MAGILDGLKRQPAWSALARGLQPLVECAESAVNVLHSGVIRLRHALETRVKSRKVVETMSERDFGKLLRLAVLYLIGAGFADWVLHAAARRRSEELSPTLLPSYFAPPTYKQELITYVLIVFFIIGIFILSSLWNYFPRRQLIPRLHPFFLFFIAVAGFIGSSTFLSTSFFALAIATTLIFWRSIAENNLSLRGARIWLRATHFLLPLGCPIFILFSPLVYYPVNIINDYYELSDQIPLSPSVTNSLFGGAGNTLSQSQAAKCMGRETIEKRIEDARTDITATPGDVVKRHMEFLIAEALPNYQCPPPNEIGPTAYSVWSPIFRKVGTWQVLAGRLMFHHAYLFVPAHHFLEYG